MFAAFEIKDGKGKLESKGSQISCLIGMTSPFKIVASFAFSVGLHNRAELGDKLFSIFWRLDSLCDSGCAGLFSDEILTMFWH